MLICIPKPFSIKNLFANISLAVLLNLLVKPVWVLVEMSVQNVVGHEAWGMYAGLLSFAFLFITLADLGVNQYLTKTLASEPERLQKLYPNLFGLKLVLLAAYPVVMLVPRVSEKGRKNCISSS